MFKFLTVLLYIIIGVLVLTWAVIKLLNKYYYHWDDVYYREFMQELNKPKGVKIMHSEELFYRKLGHNDILDVMALFKFKHKDFVVEGPNDNDIFVVKCTKKMYDTLSFSEKNLYFVYYYVED